MSCPACGGPVELSNRSVKMVVCPYCGNTLAVQPDGLDPTGKSAKLADYPTRFSIGATGALHGKPYRILGRVRFQDDESYWDEWYLELHDGEIAWPKRKKANTPLAQAAAHHAGPIFRGSPSRLQHLYQRPAFLRHRAMPRQSRRSGGAALLSRLPASPCNS